MDDLIEGLQIFRKYLQPDDSAMRCPTNCSHDQLTVCVAADAVTDQADRARLDQLGFNVDADLDCWYSYRFGSA